MSETGSLVQRVGALAAGPARKAETSTLKPRSIAFGVFELDVATLELRKEGRLIHLRHQPVRVLRLLIERVGQLVTRAEITDTLWPDAEVDVDVEQGVNHCMKEIRAALGDRPDSPRFIQTLPRRGYRFLMEVRDIAASSGASTAPRPSISRDPADKRAEPLPEDPDQSLSDGRFE
jgi:DNA-binding winged helix-turn-helix (wHTH) protein